MHTSTALLVETDDSGSGARTEDNLSIESLTELSAMPPPFPSSYKNSRPPPALPHPPAPTFPPLHLLKQKKHRNPLHQKPKNPTPWHNKLMLRRCLPALAMLLPVLCRPSTRSLWGCYSSITCWSSQPELLLGRVLRNPPNSKARKTTFRRTRRMHATFLPLTKCTPAYSRHSI
jgi:hypothetical protein